MDLHLSFKSSSKLATLSNITWSKLPTHLFASITHNGKSTFLRRIAARKMTGLAVGIILDRFILSHLPASLKRLIGKQTKLIALPSLYAKLLI